MPVVASLPEYFAEKGYKNPSDASNGPCQYAYQTQDHYFDWYAKRPELQRVFNAVMSQGRMGRGMQWFDFYPVEEKLRVKSPSDTVLVDIGGGLGHDLINLKNRFPNLEGKLILEDLPHVLAAIEDLPSEIQTTSHDFLKPQPSCLKGAKAYYLRTVLHDWPDKQATTILQNIRELMTQDAILLINESPMPDVDVPPKATFYDFMMMVSFSSLDRTEEQFSKLLDASGFKLVQVWRPNNSLAGPAVLFEAVIKD
jgi:hypothetical protein